MKRLFFCMILFHTAYVIGSSCNSPEVIDRLQELQRCIDTIKSKVSNFNCDNGSILDELSILGEILCSKIENIDINVNISSVDVQVSGIDGIISASDSLICSKLESIENLISLDDYLILSAIDNIVIPPAQVSGIDELISESDSLICSKLESIESLISRDDFLILSAIENISVTVNVSAADVQVSGIEELISASDAFICSKIGNFDDEGTCLDSQIDVPTDVNDLNLNIIQLLKTILLELRGCGGGPAC